MIPLRDDPQPSSPSSSKMTLLTSIRRLTPKLKREQGAEEQGRFAVEPALHSTSTSFRSKYSPMTHEFPRTPSPSSVYCPPLSPPPTQPPKRRVRMSGSRLPSGYRPRSTLTPIPPLSSLDTRIPESPQPQPSSGITPTITPQPLRTRLTRFLHRHSTPPCPPSTTPTSSTLSFPSSTSRTTTTPSSPSSSPTASRKQVRFSPSINSARDDEKQPRSMERERVVVALSRIGSPWKKSHETKVDAS